MARLRNRGSSKKQGKKNAKRNMYAHSYKQSKAAALERRISKIGATSRPVRIIVPPMPYEDTLEVSRLAEALVKGHDISHVASTSQAAKEYVVAFSKRNSRNDAAVKMYNKVNRRLVQMNKHMNAPTRASQELYSALISEELSAE